MCECDSVSIYAYSNVYLTPLKNMQNCNIRSSYCYSINVAHHHNNSQHEASASRTIKRIIEIHKNGNMTSIVLLYLSDIEVIVIIRINFSCVRIYAVV